MNSEFGGWVGLCFWRYVVVLEIRSIARTKDEPECIKGGRLGYSALDAILALEQIPVCFSFSHPPTPDGLSQLNQLRELIRREALHEFPMFPWGRECV